ncbi:hypothetical protein BDP55DRAFT_386613 [Colletotrichum godetiae]|uniref:Uncharacterized protein n=1 Tax=Colletotrichum godetiae TaxID=1209918 RepID=A0AAJ0AW06_9PEZI|nr:uncharacterized protein BDP55DRAFT_386613 [Colletotrichum godetiae]KAK1690016.1 hypothetical protein BDP55DRAFT_386613 [Colletotrichum godetiae]
MQPTSMVANAVSSIGSALRIPHLILRAVLFLVSVNICTLLPLTTTHTNCQSHRIGIPQPSRLILRLPLYPRATVHNLDIPSVRTYVDIRY